MINIFNHEFWKIKEPKNFILITTTFGFFMFFSFLIFAKIPDGTPHDLLLTTFGAITVKWGTIVDFFFGSSSGSQRKTDLMNLASNSNSTTVTTSEVKTEEVKKD